ncbi:acyltransferase ChoActase/COT/CPT [Conidiobolus coronatus NRRL 28638]|uniref:Acyltransferase ChoActase/COT/CPT n=1 Tax=Conidiobolus coronatus (strain ATCC 28846 / CBS 209.66 / NRRL 28638) TaxID=796925 RepID=A0A137P7D0_CONC2|nr:acyltransferase ChoActase/COT/CPT [Conidiobolus coronatus NRRL 28638]|eukprot:KXN70844.1 acyltransferase ChoActase/COT/CPT [Conidiobolus coronatus NRRL 28638]
MVLKLNNILKVKQQIKSCRLYSTQQVKTFEYQSKLPRLPVPSLQHTLELYEKSTLPLRFKDDDNGVQESIRDFIKPGGQGQELQKRLEAYDKQHPNNWLEDIWLDKAYLSWRGPSFLNVNFWAEFVDHPDGLDPSPSTQSANPIQLERASGLIHQLLNFNDKLNREEIAPDMSKEGPLCMNQYKHIFGTSRVPKPGCDVLISPHPTTSNYIVLSYKDRLVKVPVYTENAAVDHLVQAEHQLPIGVLTTEHRDTWTEARSHLEGLSKRNAENLKTIDDALFVVCLDTLSIGNDQNETHHYLMHRYDAGINGEHSPADAITVGRIMTETIVNETDTQGNFSKDVEIQPIQLLNWDTDSKIKSTIETAKTNANKLSFSFRSELSVYDDYGANFLKKGKVSPDAYVQMALQLAYYRTHGEPCATYETASTRGFLHGRTETVRSCSWESYIFTQVANDSHAKRSQKQEALNIAIKSHIDYMKKASAGLGVDRHLLGLRCMLKPDEPVPSLFTNPYFAKSGTYVLSTSNMSPGTYLYGGFAPVTEDGYGVNYAISKDNIRYSCSDWATSAVTDHKALKKEINRALDDMGELLG